MSVISRSLSFALRCMSLQNLFSRSAVAPQLYKSFTRVTTLTFTPRVKFTSSGDTSVNPILDEVEAKVFQVLRSGSKCKIEKLSRSATFEELGFDSLDSVELVVAMEEIFGFDITNEEAERITTVQEAIAVFNKNLMEKINRDKLVEIQENETNLSTKN